jgi:hypothetical protein
VTGLEWEAFALLAVIALLAGFVDAVAGGVPRRGADRLPAGASARLPADRPDLVVVCRALAVRLLLDPQNPLRQAAASVF